MSVFLGASPTTKKTASKAEKAPARDLGGLSRADLAEKAARMGLRFTTRTTKAQLVAMIEEAL